MASSEDNIPVCAVTGANGYVGGVIAAALARAGGRVVHLSRAATGGAGRFSLDESPSPVWFDGVEALIHCAYDFGPRDREGIDRLNVRGSIRLFEAARNAGVGRLVFISSMSAFTGCKSLYGQAKMAVESQATRLGITIVRPGLVYGRAARGMVGSLMRAAAIPGITPLVGLGNQASYLAHEEDLGELIIGLARGRGPVATPILAAHPTPRTFRQVLEILAAVQGRKKKLFVPIPATAIWAGLKGVELLGVPMRMRSDSLISLLHQESNPDFSAMVSVGVAFRPFTAAAFES